MSELFILTSNLIIILLIYTETTMRNILMFCVCIRQCCVVWSRLRILGKGSVWLWLSVRSTTPSYMRSAWGFRERAARSGVCLCLSVSVCVCLCLSVSVYVCVYVSVCVRSHQEGFWDTGRGCCNWVCVCRDGRVLGVLEVSRSIGDGQYKRCGVISTPDVRRCQLSRNDRWV